MTTEWKVIRVIGQEDIMSFIHRPDIEIFWIDIVNHNINIFKVTYRVQRRV